MNKTSGGVARAARRARQAFAGLGVAGKLLAATAVAAPLLVAATMTGGPVPAATADAASLPAWGDLAAAGNGDGGVFRSQAALLAHDLDDELERIALGSDLTPVVARNAGPVGYPDAMADFMASLPKDAYGNPDFAKVDPAEYQRKMAEVNAALAQDLAAQRAPPAEDEPPVAVAGRDHEGMDLDDALALLAELAVAAAGDDALLDRVRGGQHGAHAGALVTHAAVLMGAGDLWGAVANLLVAHERDAADATPLVNLAALANSQRLPRVALALLQAARERDIAADDAVAGIRERAAWLNNFGHALILAGRPAEAEAPLRQALAINPELSEAARNLAHVLMRQGRADEAKALVPRAIWRLPGKPDAQVPVHARASATPAQEAQSEAPDPVQWLSQPYLVEDSAGVRFPLRIALDLSRQGQVAWPAIAYPEDGKRYAATLDAATQQLLATQGKGLALGIAYGNQVGAVKARHRGLGAQISEIIDNRIVELWTLHPISSSEGQWPLSADIENAILGTRSPTAPAQLTAARAEYQMENSAEQYFKDLIAAEEAIPEGATEKERCRAMNAAIDRNVGRLTPQAREYEDRMRVFFREAYGLSTAYASNIGHPAWRGLSRTQIEARVMEFHAHVQREITFAFAKAAPPSWGCYDEVDSAAGVAPEVAVEIPECSAGMQWASGKWAFGDTLSMEATCGKVKFVAEVSLFGTKKASAGKIFEVGADLGLHAEVEFDMAGTVTMFAGPKAGVAAKIGGLGGDASLKEGLYMVLGREGVSDVGFRMVMGGGVSAGQFGGTHDFATVNVSFVSAI